MKKERQDIPPFMFERVMTPSFGQGLSDQESLKRVREVFASMNEYPDNSTSRIERFVSQNPDFFMKTNHTPWGDIKTNNERTTKTMTTNESLSQKQAEAKKLQDQLATVEAEINRLTEIQETECNVTMRPVCDCGHVFTELSIDVNMIDENHRSTTPDINIPRFNPVTCPNCHKRIMGIKNPAYRNSGMCSEGNIVTFAKAN